MAEQNGTGSGSGTKKGTEKEGETEGDKSASTSRQTTVRITEIPSSDSKADLTTTASDTETSAEPEAAARTHLSFISKEEEEELLHKYDYKPPTAVKKFILVNNKPIAVAIESEELEHEKEKKIVQQLEHSMRKSERWHSYAEHGRTYRIGHPNFEKRKSVTVKTGGRRENIFGMEHIQKKTYAEWKKEAQAQLPSVTGGTQVDNLDDVVNIASAVQKHNDTRALERMKKKISEESTAEATMKKRATVKFAADAEGLYLHDEEEDEEQDDNLTEAQKAAMMGGVDIKAKIKNLKELADHLVEKKVIRKKIIAAAKGDDSDYKRVTFKDHFVSYAEHLHTSLRDMFSWLMIWEKEINEINGRFGIVVSTYFVWLRRILYLSMLTFITTFFLIMIPEFVEYKMYPPNVHFHSTPSFHLTDLLHGGGSLENTFLFYSGYQNYKQSGGSILQNAAARFAIVILIIYFVNTSTVISRVAKFYHTTRLESKVLGVAQTTHFKLIICAWEFSCDNAEASYYLHKSIGRELAHIAKHLSQKDRELEEIETNKKKKLLAYLVKHLGLKWGNLAMHLISNVFLLMCCATQGAILYVLCSVKRDYYIDCIPVRDDGTVRYHNHTHNRFCPDGDLSLMLWVLSCPAIFASITTLALTKVIIMLGDMESWEKTERKLLAGMVRAGLFNFTSLIVFYGFWMAIKKEISNEGYVAESLYGEELYRLVVIQGLFDIIFNCGGKYVYHLIRKRRNRFYKKNEFRPEYCAQEMFFLYPVQLMGTLFCPPISILVSIRLVINFYWHRFELLKLSSQETYSAHASIVYAPYLLTFLLYFLFSAFLQGIYFTESSPSQINGPFLSYKHSYDEVIIEMFAADGSMSWLYILFSRGGLFSWIAILLAMLYFCRQWALAYKPIQEQLNELILFERGDRELLLKAIFEIASVTGEEEEEEPESSVTSSVATPEPQSPTEDYKKLEKKVDMQIDHFIAQVQRSIRSNPTALRQKTTNTGGGNQSNQANPQNAAIIQMNQQQKKHQEELKKVIGHIVDARRNLEGRRKGAKKTVGPSHGPTPSRLFSMKR